MTVEKTWLIWFGLPISGNRRHEIWYVILELEEKECMTNPAGNGYRGTKNEAAVSGRSCLNWIDVKNYTITAALTVSDISTAVNYCRRVPIAEWDGPSCVTKDQFGTVRLERCDVPYCGVL